MSICGSEHEASERKSREKPGAQKGECGHEVQEQLQQQREFERIQFLHIANLLWQWFRIHKANVASPYSASGFAEIWS